MKEIKVYELSDGTIERDLKKAQKKEILFKIKSFGLGIENAFEDGFYAFEPQELFDFFEDNKEEILLIFKDMEELKNEKSWKNFRNW